MSHDLHSLIDQAVERTKQSATSGPSHSARDIAQNRVSGWQAELARFTEEFQQDISELLEDVARLSTEACRLDSVPPAVAPERPRTEHIPDPQTVTTPATRPADQEQDRLSALKDRLSRQLNTGMTTNQIAASVPRAPQKGAQP